MRAGFGAGERAGREPSGAGARAVLRAAAAGASHDELDAWPLDRCVAHARAHRRPKQRERTVWEAFEAERPSLAPYAGRFGGLHAVPAPVSKACLVRLDDNRYSVAAGAVGRPVEVRAHAGRIELRQDGRVVGERRRPFGRGQTVSDPWHYAPALARKPGALRNGAPFKDWLLPGALERVRLKLAGAPDGGRQTVAALAAAPGGGPAAVEAACAEALREGVHSADVVPNIPARRRGPAPPVTVLMPDALAAAAPRARRRLRPPRPPEEEPMMERSEILATMGELKLHGMRAAFDRIVAAAVERQHEPRQATGDLLAAETAEERARSIKCQMTIAKLPLAKGVDEFSFADTPVNEALTRDLAGGDFLAHQRNAVLVGGTGAGKTHLATGIARTLIRGRASTAAGCPPPPAKRPRCAGCGPRG